MRFNSILNKVLTILCILCGASMQSMTFAADNAQLYYNEVMGYLSFEGDTLNMYTPIESDSLKFRCRAQCQYSYYDSTHIRIQTFNSMSHYKLNMDVHVMSHATAPHDSTRTFEIHIVKSSQEVGYALNMEAYDIEKNRLLINFKDSTENGITRIIASNECNNTIFGSVAYDDIHKIHWIDIVIQLKDYNYTESNPNGSFYGRIFLRATKSLLEVGDWTSTKIVIENVTPLEFDQFYIPESYLTVSSSKECIFWRGFKYILVPDSNAS